MASPSSDTEQKPSNTSPNQKDESKESSVSPDIPYLEHLFRVLTNWNLGLLIVGGVIALAIGGLSVAIDRVSGQLLDAKEAEVKAKQLELAKAQKEAAEAQLELQRIVEYTATPRRVVLNSRDHDEAIRRPTFKELQKYAGTMVLVMPIPGDNEAKTLTNDIEFVLLQAGWKVKVVELPADIPPWSISNGVQVRTTVRFAEGEVKLGETKTPSQPPAVAAVTGFLSLDLAPPPFGVLGVSWDPEIIYPDGYPKGFTRGLLKYGFSIPDGEVVITVGAKPTWEFFTTHNPASPPANK